MMARWTVVIAFGVFGAVAETNAQATLVISADPQLLQIREAAAGTSPKPAVDRNTMYALDTSFECAVVARLDAPLPPGVELRITMKAPEGAAASGPVTLTTLRQPLVTGIQPGTYTSLEIAYELTAVVAAGIVPVSVRHVSFEVIAEQDLAVSAK